MFFLTFPLGDSEFYLGICLSVSFLWTLVASFAISLAGVWAPWGQALWFFHTQFPVPSMLRILHVQNTCWKNEILILHLSTRPWAVFACLLHWEKVKHNASYDTPQHLSGFLSVHEEKYPIFNLMKELRLLLWIQSIKFLKIFTSRPQWLPNWLINHLSVGRVVMYDFKTLT